MTTEQVQAGDGSAEIAGAQQPAYETYTLGELRDARAHIDESMYPERASRLDALIARYPETTRKTESYRFYTIRRSSDRMEIEYNRAAALGWAIVYSVFLVVIWGFLTLWLMLGGAALVSDTGGGQWAMGMFGGMLVFSVFFVWHIVRLLGVVRNGLLTVVDLSTGTIRENDTVVAPIPDVNAVRVRTSHGTEPRSHRIELLMRNRDPLILFKTQSSGSAKSLSREIAEFLKVDLK